MNHYKYQRPLPDLPKSFPLILVGPILRRAEEKQVCIWLACSRSATITVKIFKCADLTNAPASVAANPADHVRTIGSGTARTLQLGKRLHVGLVTVNPSGGLADHDGSFPMDELLAYDIEVTDTTSSKTMNLKDLGLLDGRNSIVYTSQNDVSLPTFFLRGEKSPLNLLHGSCRKLHGKGEDCLVAADQVISSSLQDLKTRPSVLFLTGDQIYADDVADPLSKYLTQLGAWLLGWEEEIIGLEKRLVKMQIGERQKLVEEYASFTSPNAGNHLLSFGEYAAMYLLAWNVENWPESYPEMSTIPKKRRRKFRRQIKQLEITRKDLPAVRRLFANIPTYMIFDDHEITDDWNITNEWREKVRASRCGKQVVANGLAAYWVFQGWGNDPSLYSSDFVDRIIEFLALKGDVNESQEAAFEDHLWNFNSWTFRAPIDPLTIVTDCRTQRHYDSWDGPPRLLSDESFGAILQAAQDARYKKGNPVIMISPTPVFGFLLIEALQRIVAKITSVYTIDLETWFANESGFVSFLSFLMQSLGPRHCIFLSGDVHYGFTISAAFALVLKKLGEPQEDLHMSVTQLTSSALKTTSLVKIAFISEIMSRIRELFPWKQVVRVGRAIDADINGTYRLSSKSLTLERHPTFHLEVKPRKKIVRKLPMQEQEKQPLDWVEARSIVKPSGSGFPPLLISDNNVGLVSIDESKIIHRFLVRKEMTKDTRIHQTAVEIDHGRNALDELVRAKMMEFWQKQFSANRKEVQTS